MAKIFARPDDDITPLTIGRLTDAFMAFGAGTSTSLSGENAYVDLLKKFGESRATPVDDTTRQFIKLERTFNAQLAESETWFPGQTNYALREKMQLSAELLLHCLPDAISLQLTDEGSIFYTVRKHAFSLYLDHYLIGEFDGRDEAIVSVYKNDEKLLDFAGSLDEVVLQLNKVLAPESIVFPSFA
jgi:hypothetical protein